MELIYGRPETNEGRLPRELRCYDLLDSLGVPYHRIDHQAAMTMEACAAIDEGLDALICKNLLLCNRQGTQFYLLMLPGDKVFKTSVLSREIGSSRLSFAPPEAMEALLDTAPGSLSVLGLMNDRENRVRLLMDETLLGSEYFGCHPCVNTTSLRLPMDALLNQILPAMGHKPRIVSLGEA